MAGAGRVTVRTKDMRLAFVGPFKAWGGIERKVAILARELDALGVATDVVVLRSDQTPYPALMPATVRFFHLRNRSKLDGAFRFARYLRAHRPDAVVTTQDHAAKVALLGRKVAGINLPTYLKVTNTASRTIRRRGQRWATRLMYPWAEGVIAISEGVRDDLVAAFGLPPERIHVIYNPMVTPDFGTRMARPADHPWLAAGAPAPVILAAGRLTPQKGFDVLVRAFARLRRERPARLLILGDGRERDPLLHLAAGQGVGADVDLPGFVDDPVPYMARAALFVLSSRWEGLGNVLVEALAAGCPLVATDCPSGPREILAAGRYGELVPVEDEAALAGAMGRALASPRRPPAEAADRFRARRVARRYLEVTGLAPPAGNGP